jgi:hypothetical protein
MGFSHAVRQVIWAPTGSLMGWFAIAFLIGFLAYWQWQKQRQICVALAFAACIAAVSFAIGYACRYSLDLLLDRIGQGYVARILLGFALGNATAYVLEERATLRNAQIEALKAGGGAAKPAGDGGKGEPSVLGGIAGMGTTALLWLAAVIVFVAVAAPHLDGWLRRMTSLKLPFGELQVASVNSHASIAADSIDVLADYWSMTHLGGYHERIRQDAEYINQFEIPELEKRKTESPGSSSDIQKQIDKAKLIARGATELYPVFNLLISPIARCVDDAVSNGLALDSIRLKARPMADALQHILFLEKENTLDPGYGPSHDKFWSELKKLPALVEPLVSSDLRTQCSQIVNVYESNQLNKGALPELRKYKTIPYLYVASILFASFMKDEDVLLHIIERKKGDLRFMDFPFQFYAGFFAYNYSRGLDAGFAIVDDMRKVARERRGKLRDKYENCKRANCSEEQIGLISTHLKRANSALLLATNNLAYYAAGDLARGGKAGERYQARLGELVKDLQDAITREDDEEAKYGYQDTSAYVTLVLESQKRDPDIGKIKDMVAKLKSVVEFSEKRAAGSFTVDRYLISALKVARSHLAAAQELAGQ